MTESDIKKTIASSKNVEEAIAKIRLENTNSQSIQPAVDYIIANFASLKGDGSGVKASLLCSVCGWSGTYEQAGQSVSSEGTGAVKCPLCKEFRIKEV